MRKYINLFIISTVLLILGYAEANRCFSFTWLGPRYTNVSVFMNATCNEATSLAAGVPCFQPLVVSYDGSRPNVSYIWQHHALQASCEMADADVCATYSYFFNGFVENVTHMCTRVVEAEGMVITDGCYDQVNGNSRVQVCFCRSVPGEQPCNSAPVHATLTWGAGLLLNALLGYVIMQVLGGK